MAIIETTEQKKETTPWGWEDYKTFILLADKGGLNLTEMATVLKKPEKTIKEYLGVVENVRLGALTPPQLANSKYLSLIDAACEFYGKPKPIRSRKPEEAYKFPENGMIAMVDATQMARIMYVLGKIDERLEEIEKYLKSI